MFLATIKKAYAKILISLATFQQKAFLKAVFHKYIIYLLYFWSMKKLVTISVLAIGLFSCKKLDQPKPAPAPRICNCEVQLWIRSEAQPDNDASYRFSTVERFYSNRCEDNGLRIPGYWGHGLHFQRRIICK